jgi:hypothetical protein
MTQKPNLIGVAGRAGSGKDTVGSIVKYWLNYRREHKAGNYSSYVLMDHWYSSEDWQVKKFADKLKQIASLLLGVPAGGFEDQNFKSSCLPREWDTIVSKPGKRQDGIFGTGEKLIKQMTVREFLQLLGTEAIRNGLHLEAWVNALFADYKALNLTHNISSEGRVPLAFPNWIITDLRFPNEFEAIKSRGGLCIKVDDSLIHMRSKLPEHSSEKALDSHTFDYVLNNSGSIDDLIEEVRKMLVHFKLLNLS